MKRFFAFILLLVFMTFKCLTWIPSAAMTGIPAFDAFYYAIMQSLGMAITNGVDIDIAGEIANVRESIPDYLQQPDVALKYLLRDYIGKAWEKFSINLNEIWAPEDPYLMNTAAIGISNSSGVSIPTLQDIVAQWEGKALDNDLKIVVPIDSDSVAYWNKYDNTWINTYLDRVNAVPDDIVEPPSDLPTTITNYIHTLNSDGFFWAGKTAQYGDLHPDYYINNASDVSWFYQNGALGGSLTISDSFNTYNEVSGLLTSPILTFDIVGSDNSYALSLRGSIDYSYNYATYSSQYFSFKYTTDIFTNRGLAVNSMTFNNYWKVNTSKLNYAGTLDQCFLYLSKYFRNINVYVNGELWALAGTGYVPNFAATVPNAIDSGLDDGKIVSNPIYWVVDENTGLPIDSQINLDKFIDYLIGVIDGTNDDTSIDYHDLVDAGVIEKQDGSTISDTEIVPVPIADVIDDSISRADPLSIPVAITGSLPPLPPLPPFFPTPDFPEGDPTSGFNGMSVLARIINITNQSLPDELVITFYGVMFGAIVLGLIKILHK